MQEMERIPVVDVLRAARMLRQDRNWVQARRAELGPIYYAATDLPDMVFPLAEIRRFARENSLDVTPLPIESGALWAKRNP
jgi:hypothetical protein